MGIELPGELADVAVKAGVQWPQADEEAMRSSAQAWRQAGTTIDSVAKDADGTANKALGAVTGSTGTAAQQHWHTFVAPDTGHLTSTAKGCLDAADRLDHAADQVGAAKVQIVKHLVTLAKNTDAADAAAAAGHPTALAGLHTTVQHTATSVAQVNHSLTTSIRLDHTPVVQAGPVQTTPSTPGQPGQPGQPGLLGHGGLLGQNVPVPSHDPVAQLTGQGPLAPVTHAAGTHDLLGAQGALGAHGPVDVAGTVAPVVGGSGHPGHDVGLGGLDPDHTGPVPVGQLNPAGPVGHPGQLGQLDQLGQPGQLAQPVQLGQSGHPGQLDQLGQPGQLGQTDPSGQLGPVGVTPVGVTPVGMGPGGMAPAAPVLPGHHAGSPGVFGQDPHGEPTPPMGVTVTQSAAPAPVAPAADFAQGAGSVLQPVQPVAHQPMPSAPASFSAPTPSFGTPVVANPAPPPAPSAVASPTAQPAPAPAARGGSDLIGAVDVQRPAQAGTRQGPRSAAVAPGPDSPNVLPDVGIRPTRPDARRDAVALFLVYLFPIGQLPRASSRPDRQLPPPAQETDFAAGLRFEPHDHPESALIDPEPGEMDLPPAHPGFAAQDPEVLALADGHDPLGGQHERDWDRRFLVRPADRDGGQAAEYAWPPGELFPEGGCADGEPVVLAEDTVVDRFGTPEGRVFAEDGTPFASRSLPPDQLAAGYHRYRVTRALPMWRTLSAAWFGQPGGGVRYRAVYPAADLVAMGHLTEITGTDNGH
jgi:hypothetical protein